GAGQQGRHRGAGEVRGIVTPRSPERGTVAMRKKYAKPALVIAFVAALAAAVWWQYRATRTRPPRPLAEGEMGLLVLESSLDGREHKLVRYAVGSSGGVGPGEVVWAGDPHFFGWISFARVEGRHLVTNYGGVIDLNRGKIVHDRRSRSGGRTTLRAI